MNDLSSRFTPIDDSDPSCERTDATLAIYHVDPTLVTEKLSVTPTSSQGIGVARVMPSGKEVIGTTNSWLLSSEKEVISKDLRRHLDWLLDRLEPTGAQLRELQQFPGAKMTIWCVWWSAVGRAGGPTLWPEQMDRLARLNLEIGFTFAYYGDDDEKGMPPQETE